MGDFFFATTSRPSLEPTQPPIRWVKLTTYLHLVPRSRMRRPTPGPNVDRVIATLTKPSSWFSSALSTHRLRCGRETGDYEK